MAQIGEDDQTEDGGADTAAHNEENKNRRIARRIPVLMKDVWEVIFPFLLPFKQNF